MAKNNATTNKQKTDDQITANSDRVKRGEHPNSKSNLNPYEKGVSGNPSGRPSKYENLKKVLKSSCTFPP